MGILTRFKDIMASNVNALLDKAEDPEKMIDQYLRNLEDDYAEVKAETASVMAEAKSAQRKVDECNEEIKKMETYAVKAVQAGDATLVVVTNEVGDGIVPMNHLAREFRDLSGLANQLLARQAEEVYLVTDGIPIDIKQLEYKL